MNDWNVNTVTVYCVTTQFSSAKASFGFEAPFTLAEGLERTLQCEFGAEAAGGPVFYTE